MPNSVIPWIIDPRLFGPWDFPGKNTRPGCHFLIQEIFPTQRLKPNLLCLLYWQVDSLALCHLDAHSDKSRQMDEYILFHVQFSHSVVSKSLRPHGLQHARLPCITKTQNLHELMSIKSVLPSNHQILYPPLLLLPSILPSIRVFS